MAHAKTYRLGDKVYLDTIASGLVPGVVVEIRPKTNKLVVRITGKRPGYRVGELEEASATFTVMREWIRHRRGSPYPMVHEPAGWSASTPRKRTR